MKNLKNFIANTLYGVSIIIYILGFFHSIIASTETYTSWGEKVTEFDVGLWAKYFFTTLILGTLFLAFRAIIQYLFNIQETLNSIRNLQLTARLQRDKIEKYLKRDYSEDYNYKEQSKTEILSNFEYANNNCIYDYKQSE